MPLVALHAASVEQRSGVLVFAGSGPWRVRIELQRGWVHGFGIEPSHDPEPPALRERRVRDAALTASVAPTPANSTPPARLAQLLRLIVHARLTPTLLDEGRLPYIATTPFHPLAALRATVSELLADVEERATKAIDMTARSLRIALPLHASALDPDEQTATKLLANTRSWDELVRKSRTTPQRLTTLLRDAAALGALRVNDTAVDELGPLLLRIMREAPAELAARRAAYHAEARAVHPDLHPDADDDEARRLNDAMAELASRHRAQRE